jgi:predicted transposase YbfD/YdcC
MKGLGDRTGIGASQDRQRAGEMAGPPFAVFHCFSSLRDPRHSCREKKHLFMDVLTIAICAVIGGADDWPKMAVFARERRDWLSTFLALPNGVPSHDTFERIFELLSPKALQRCFLRWIEGVIGEQDDKHFAIDGKALRGSRNATSGQRPLHLVSVWSTQAGLGLGQLAVAQKSNEITAIPILLNLLDLENAWITIDAMGCQKNIAAKIVEGKGNYALAVKRNQGHLAQDLKAAFAAAEQSRYQGLSTSQYRTEEQGHGRRETRQYTVICNPEDIRNKEEWKSLAVIGKCDSVRLSQGKTLTEERYFIGSKEAEAKVYGTLLRNHWRIENCLHWQLDVTFREDHSHIRRRNAAENFALLRRLALCLLKRHPAKDSLATKRYNASLSVSFLEEVLDCGRLTTE